MRFKLPKLSKLSAVPRRYLVFAGLIIIIAVASAGIAVFLSLQQMPSGDDGSSGQGEDAGRLQELPAIKESDEALKQAYEGDVKGGVEKLDAAIQNTNDSQEKFIYQSNKANLLYNNGNMDGALAAALEAFATEKTSESAALVGQFASEKGDKALAAEYYKKAIPLIDPNDPFADEDREYYQMLIDELEGRG